MHALSQPKRKVENFGTRTSEDMGAVLGSQVEFNPVTMKQRLNAVSKRAKVTTQSSDQSKSKGMASGLMLAL